MKDSKTITSNKKLDLYEFTIENKDGKTTKQSCPCDDWMEAYRVQKLLMKSKNVESVMFVNKSFSRL